MQIKPRIGVLFVWPKKQIHFAVIFISLHTGFTDFLWHYSPLPPKMKKKMKSPFHSFIPELLFAAQGTCIPDPKLIVLFFWFVCCRQCKVRIKLEQWQCKWLIVKKKRKNCGSGGIRTHASERLVPKTSALDHSATLPRCFFNVAILYFPVVTIVPPIWPNWQHFQLHVFGRCCSSGHMVWVYVHRSPCSNFSIGS